MSGSGGVEVGTGAPFLGASFFLAEPPELAIGNGQLATQCFAAHQIISIRF